MTNTNLPAIMNLMHRAEKAKSRKEAAIILEEVRRLARLDALLNL